MQEVIGAALRRIIRDKILLGLVLVGLLGIFVGGLCGNDDPKDKAGKGGAAKNAPQEEIGAKPAQAQTNPNQEQQAPAPAGIDSNLATDFVKWWVSKAMDYSHQTADASHVEAFRWMNPQAVQSFQANFWPPDIEAGIRAGSVTAAFQPVSVQAVCVNPDGTVVVSLAGTLMIQSSGSPVATQQINADFLVQQEKDGLRIAGLYNRALASAPPPQQPAQFQPSVPQYSVTQYQSKGPQYGGALQATASQVAGTVRNAVMQYAPR